MLKTPQSSLFSIYKKNEEHLSVERLAELERKEELRKLRSRESAERSRKRKTDYLHGLEEENKKLHELLEKSASGTPTDAPPAPLPLVAPAPIAAPAPPAPIAAKAATPSPFQFFSPVKAKDEDYVPPRSSHCVPHPKRSVEERTQRKKLHNKISAKAARERKKQLIADLKKSVTELTAVNQKLRRQLEITEQSTSEPLQLQLEESNARVHALETELQALKDEQQKQKDLAAIFEALQNLPYETAAIEEENIRPATPGMRG